MGSSSVGTATMPAKEQPGLSNILESTQVMAKWLEKAFLWGQERGQGRQVDLMYSSSDSLKLKVDIKYE